MQRRLAFPKLISSEDSASLARDTMDGTWSPISHSRQSSQSTTSECSPVTPTYSARGHHRFPSSTSSLVSSPGHLDQQDIPTTAHKPLPALPDVVEDPMERESQIEGFGPSNSFELEESVRWFQPDMRATQSAVFYPSPPEYDLRDGYFSDHETGLGRLTKRRKSGESYFNTFANRIVARLPSLSKRNRGTKSPSILDLEDEGELHSPHNAISRSTSRASHRLPSGSNSRVGSLRRRTNELEMEKVEAPRAPTQIETIAEDEPRDGPHSPMDMLNDSDIVDAHPESQERASTPLLPPLMADPQYTIPIQSPLQSPAVAAHSGAASSSDSPAGTPHVSSMTSLPLSVESSSSSVHRSRATTLVPVSEIPPVPITDSDDEWANILGHNNFHILPEPYIPKHCNSQSCDQLLSDWQKARLEYAKHRARTSTHFGHTSKTYRLTEDKWADIDARWKRNNEIAALKAVKNGETLPGQPMMEPAPVAMIPSINGSGDGKFPTLGDDDIVGPMVQVPPQLQRRPSKKAQLLKILGSIARPGAPRNRASSSHQ